MNYLEMKHIKKHFDELEVLKDISLNVRESPPMAGLRTHCARLMRN